MEPKNGGGWKMIFLFNWVIFTFKMLISRGVDLLLGAFFWVVSFFCGGSFG